MNRTIFINLVLTLCILLSRSTKAEIGSDPNNKEEKVVTIELNKLDVNDTTLELLYKIKNNTEHDVWVCNNITGQGVGVRNNVNTLAQPFFEVFLIEDTQTLLIRRRLDVPSRAIWRTKPAGSYVLLRQGEDMTESLSLNLPVQSSVVYANLGRTKVTQKARCLALEIGFYDEDLPALVRSIIIEADRFSGTTLDMDASMAIIKEYFRGLLVRGSLGGLTSFDKINKDPYSEGQVVINYSYQALTGEKVLQLKVDGVSIPYKGEVQVDSPGRI